MGGDPASSGEKKMKVQTVGGIRFHSTTNDANGNPRYVFTWMMLADAYEDAVKIGKGIGAKIYRGKDFGGGLVFTSYNLAEDAEVIKQVSTSRIIQQSA